MIKEISEKIEHWKAMAGQLLDEDKRVYICDINNQFYFADILFVGDKSIEIHCFSPKDKKGIKFNINWFKVKDLDEYKPVSQSLKARSKNE